jgi:hypothetical protein
VGEYAAKVESGLKASPEVIANEYARAQHAREQMAEKTGDVLQKVGNAIYSGKSESQDWKTDAPEIKATTGFKQTPDQAANVSKLYQDGLKDHAAGKVFNDTPAPPIKRQSVAETINALLDAVKKSGATNEADIQAAVFDGYSKLFNPCDLDDKDLLRVAGKIISNTPEASFKPQSLPKDKLDLAASKGAYVSPEASFKPQSLPKDKLDLAAKKKQALSDAVRVIKAAIESGELTRATFPPCKDLLKNAGIGNIGGSRQELIAEAFEELAALGLLKISPEYDEANPRSGKQKYIICNDGSGNVG